MGQMDPIKDMSGTGVMAGDGFYDRHSVTQRKGAALGLELLLRAVADLEPSDGLPVTVADLGAAQGHNSLAAMRTVVAALTERHRGDINVVHTDLASNDWATLFSVIDADPESYLIGRDDVHPFVVGRSFYDRLFSQSGVHLAWTSSTLHWLSKQPGPIADHFFVQSSTDAQAKERYRARSAADWTAFLAHRAVELVRSGSVVFVDVLMGDDGSMGSEALFDSLEASVRAARDRGALSEAEYAATAYPTWFRSLAELQKPFDPEFIGPGGERLAMVELDPVELDDPFLADYQRDADAMAYGRAHAGFLRGFLEPSFRAVWPRAAHEQSALVAQVFDDTAARIASDPEAVSPAYRLVTGRISRVA